MGERRWGSISLVTYCTSSLDIEFIQGQYQIRFEFYKIFGFLVDSVIGLKCENVKISLVQLTEGGLVFVSLSYFMHCIFSVFVTRAGASFICLITLLQMNQNERISPPIILALLMFRSCFPIYFKCGLIS